MSSRVVFSGAKKSPSRWALFTLVALTPACGSTPSDPDYTPRATEIVKITTESLAGVIFSDAEHSALKEFLQLDKVKNAGERPIIREAWTSSSALESRAPGFPDRAWRESREDQDWPQEASLPEKVYVDGFRQGIRSYLEGG